MYRCLLNGWGSIAPNGGSWLMVQLLPCRRKFRDHQVSADSQFGSLVFGIPMHERISTENSFLILSFIHDVAFQGKSILVLIP